MICNSYFVYQYIIHLPDIAITSLIIHIKLFFPSAGETRYLAPVFCHCEPIVLVTFRYLTRFFYSSTIIGERCVCLCAFAKGSKKERDTRNPSTELESARFRDGYGHFSLLKTQISFFGKIFLHVLQMVPPRQRLEMPSSF